MPHEPRRACSADCRDLSPGDFAFSEFSGRRLEQRDIFTVPLDERCWSQRDDSGRGMGQRRVTSPDFDLINYDIVLVQDHGQQCAGARHDSACERRIDASRARLATHQELIS